MRTRGELEVETLLKIILVLVVIWIGLKIVEEFFEALDFLLGPLQPFIGLILVVLIILWLLDEL
ncbi:MAG: hypothetical protein ABEJ85_00975 [Haloarculaceae archaeon]